MSVVIDGTAGITTPGPLTMTSGGITFNANPGGGTQATFNDYEVGTWSPSLGGTATYSQQNGSYVKVGQFVCVRGTLTVNTIGTGSVTNIALPFTTVAQAANGQAGTTIGYFASLASNVIAIYGTVPGNDNHIYFGSLNSSSNGISYPTNIFGNGTRVDFTVTYQTSV
jgi:hypothetical protein